MRVAMIGPFGLRPKGTVAARALPLAKALANRGHNLALFIPPWTNPDDAGVAWYDAGVRVENVAVSPRALIAPRLLSHALAWRPEVIHVFKPKGYSGLVQWLIWNLRHVAATRARLVLDEDDWEGAGGWNDLEDYSAVERMFFAMQERWGLLHCDALTVASRALETIVWSLGAPRDKVHYLPYGISSFIQSAAESGSAAREEYGLGLDPVVLIYTRFFEFSIERLAQVFMRIHEHVPDAWLLVVGKGLYGEEHELSVLAEAQGWANRLLDLGWVDPSRLPFFFAAADVALYPFDDTLVNRCKCTVKLGDLLASGVPVVAEAVGQIKEYITHEETGVLVPPGDTERFSCAALELLQNAPLRQRLGRSGRASMVRDYGWERWAAVAESAYGLGSRTVDQAPMKSVSPSSAEEGAGASSRRSR